MPLRSLFHRATNYKYFSRRRHGAEWRAIATASWNARLPATRSTEDGSAVIDTGSDASTQLKSNFFRKLPLELRRQIYLEVLAGIELLFWVPNEDKSAHGHDVGKEKIPFELSCDAARGLLSFPMSCKLAYMEAFDYIYANNTFRFAGITEYCCFTRLVAKQKLDLIQHLHLQYSYEAVENERDIRYAVPPYHIDWWSETWDAISRWKGLAHVRVDIHRYETRSLVHAYDEEYFYSPLKALGSHIELEVCVSWSRHSSVPPDEEKWPFLIRRDMKYREENDGNFRLDDH